MSLLPTSLADRVDRFLAAPEGTTSADAVDLLVADLVTFVDGKSTDTFHALMAELREVGAYPLTLRILASAWSGTLSDAMAGEVLEDWIGTLLHGLGDREAAIDIIDFVTPDALSRGAAFASDLGDLFLSWGLRAQASPLIRFALSKNPGDVSARYNLGIIHKFAGEYDESAAAFREVLVHQPEEKGALWSLGIALTAVRDFAGARTAWQRLGIVVPESDGDYARPGERLPIRISAHADAPVQAEVVWGDRLCPARARVTGIPRYGGLAAFGDVVLVDGASIGEVPGPHEGERVAIVECLSLFSEAKGRLYRLRGGPGDSPSPADAERLAVALRGLGYASINWSGVGPDSAAVGVVLAAGEPLTALAAAVSELATDTRLFCPELESEAGLPVRRAPATLSAF